MAFLSHAPPQPSATAEQGEQPWTTTSATAMANLLRMNTVMARRDDEGMNDGDGGDEGPQALQNHGGSALHGYVKLDVLQAVHARAAKHHHGCFKAGAGQLQAEVVPVATRKMSMLPGERTYIFYLWFWC
jgi:hypothetical protein